MFSCDQSAFSRPIAAIVSPRRKMSPSMTERIEYKIISHVLPHEILYNPKHPDANRRTIEQVWEEVANEMDMPVDDLRRRWKNLKDCYLKYLRTKTPAPGPKSPFLKRYATWPWAVYMAPIKPFMNYIPRLYSYAREHENEEKRTQPLATTTNSGMEKYDEVDLLFLSLAKTVKKFSLERQTIIKHKISSLVLDEELAHVRREDPLQTDNNSSVDIDMVNFTKVEIESEND